MTRLDAFEFKDLGRASHRHIDDTPCDNDIPKEYSVAEPAPPPYDADYDNPAIDLLIWAMEQIA